MLFGGAGLVLLVLTALMRGHHGGFLNGHTSRCTPPCVWPSGSVGSMVRAPWRCSRGGRAGSHGQSAGLHLNARDVERLIPTEADRAAETAWWPRWLYALRPCGPVRGVVAYAGFELNPSDRVVGHQPEGPYVPDMVAIREGSLTTHTAASSTERATAFDMVCGTTTASMNRSETWALPCVRTGWPVRPGFLLAPSE